MPPGSRKGITATPGTHSFSPPTNSDASLEDDLSPVAEPVSPFQSDSEDEDEDCRPKKGVRKQTVGLEVARILKQGRKIGGLVIPPDKFAVVGPSEKLFKMEIGVITRSLAPFRVLYWKKMEDDMKVPLFGRVASEFEIDLSDPHVKEVVDAAMAKAFRRYKHRCYEHYKKFADLEVAKKNKPNSGISELDWIALCEHFESDAAFKRASEANTANRGNTEVNHYSGSKSFIQRVYEMENSNDPETEPAEVKVYHDIHKKDGNWIHPQAEEKYEKMNELLSMENGENLTGKQIVEKVCMKPKSSYARGLGYGYKSSSARRATMQPRYEDNTHAQLREKIESQQEMIESQQNVIDEMKSSQEQFMNRVQKLLRKKRKKKSSFLKLRV